MMIALIFADIFSWSVQSVYIAARHVPRFFMKSAV